MNVHRPRPPISAVNWVLVGIITFVTVLICLLGMSMLSDVPDSSSTLTDHVSPAPHPND